QGEAATSTYGAPYSFASWSVLSRRTRQTPKRPSSSGIRKTSPDFGSGTLVLFLAIFISASYAEGVISQSPGLRSYPGVDRKRGEILRRSYIDVDVTPSA